MPSEPVVLAFDTSAAHCAAALLVGERIVIARTEDMGRGQAERLFPLLEEILSEAGKTWRDLTAIGVGVGPGNFTGIRISVSAARGLALALGIPAVGIDGFDARISETPAGHIVAISAPREQYYIRPEGGEPAMFSHAEAALLGPLHTDVSALNLIRAIAKLAASRASATTTSPSPVYVRPADAAPSRDTAPVLLDQ